MKGKHEKDMCDRCSRWKADCKEIEGREVSASQQDHPCSHFKEWKPKITLTLTREQAEALLKGVKEIRWCCQSKAMFELTKQIEEKLK